MKTLYMMKIAIAAIVAVGLITNARAVEKMDGNRLMQVCASRDRTEQNFCNGYVLGVADTVLGGNVLAPDAFPICLQEGIIISQMREIGLRYIVANPKDRHKSASYLLTMAFALAWPCPKDAR